MSIAFSCIANMADLVKPSLCPVRAQRRHLATIDFNNRVFAALSDISCRLQSLESRFASCTSPPGLTEHAEMPIQQKRECLGGAFTNSKSDVQQRLSKLESHAESILDRVALLEKVFCFVDLDAINAQLHPTPVVLPCSEHAFSVLDGSEPDKEQSPLKSSGFEGEKREDDKEVMKILASPLVFNMAAYDVLDEVPISIVAPGEASKDSRSSDSDESKVLVDSNSCDNNDENNTKDMSQAWHMLVRRYVTQRRHLVVVLHQMNTLMNDMRNTMHKCSTSNEEIAAKMQACHRKADEG